MISRTTNADRPEPLQQGSLTGMRGIDYTKPITANNVVNDMRNLTVNTDGTLSIRKPLIARKEYVLNVDGKKITASKVIPLYDSAYTLVVYINGTQSYIAIENSAKTRFPILFYGERLDNTGDFEISLPTLTGNVYDVAAVFNVTSVQPLNTSTSTILGNVTVDLTSAALREYLYVSNILDDASAKTAPRYLSVVKSESGTAVTFKLIIKNSEPNTLSTGSTLVLDPNLTADYPYAIRDSYNSRYVSIDGILPYTYCKDADTPTNLPSVSVDYKEAKADLTMSYKSSSQFLKNMVPPYNPMVMEFVGNWNAYVDNSYNSVSDSDAGAKIRDFHSKGGMCFIYFKNFKFNQDISNPLNIYNYDSFTLKPSKVTVGYKAILVNTYGGYAHKAYVNVDDPDDIIEGNVLETTTPIVFEGSNIQYTADAGYYVVCKEIPNIQALTKDTRVIAKTYNNFDSVGNVNYTCEDNLSTYVDTAGSPSRRPIYFGYLKYTKDSKTYQHIYNYSCGKKETKNGKTYYPYSGQGVIKLTMTVTVTYVQDGKTLEYTNVIDVNALKHFNGKDNRLVSPWYDADSLVGCNFPAYILAQSNVVTNGFTEASVKEAESVVKPNFDTFNTYVSNVYSFTERVDYVNVSTSGTVSKTYSPNNVTRSLTIPYTLGQLTQNIVFNATVSLKDFSSSAEVSGDVVYTPANIAKQPLKLKHNAITQTFTNTWNDEYGDINVKSQLQFIEGGYSYESLVDYTVQDITERKQFEKFQLTDVLNPSRTATTVLKAFMHLRDTYEPYYYGVWEYSTDGVNWKSYYIDPSKGTLKEHLKNIKMPKYTISEAGDITVSKDEEPVSQVCGIRFDVTSEQDSTYIALDGSGNTVSNALAATYIVPKRPDVLLLQNLSEDSSKIYCIDPELPELNTVQLRFTACTVDDENVANVLAVSFFDIATGNWKFANTLIGNAVLGRKLYHKHAIYSFGHPSFNCNILTSDINSFITPLSRLIDVSSNAEDTVTSLLPWRDYLVAFTEHDVHLITNVDNGFYTKTVSTFVGVPTKDSRTCKSILNGIVFKSGNKFYSLYPNYASSDESILNLNEISSPIDHILENLKLSNYNCFSISTNSAYYTFIPYESYTICVIYNYDNKAWQIYEYDGVRIVDYTVDNVDDIYLYGYCNGVYTEYYFDKYLHEAIPELKNTLNLTTFDEIPYGDYTTLKSLEPDAIGGLPKCTPIVFKLDTGQRIDNISTTKQFVETKVILATQSEKPASNLKIDVYVDGTPVKTRTKGGGIFYKTSPSQVLTFGDVVVNNSDSVLDTVAQAYLKYSGKGKTVRHVIEGESLYDFKLYELFYRYRIMPNKP